MGTLTIRLDEELEADLNRIAEAQHKTKSEIAREMLRRHTTIELFRLARRELMPYAEKAGYLTDEDIFRDVS
jgi:predicted transcriptional regulator